MDLHLMQQVKRLFAWADAYDDTRNMELHMQVAFGLLAEQGRTTQRKYQLAEDERDAREQVLMREVQLTQAYRWERAALATRIALGVHCSFVWVGSLTQEEPTTGYFVGCAPHVDRARLLFEVIDPDLRLLTRLIGPPEGKGTGPGGVPSGDGMDFYRSRSSAMLDVVEWIGERLHETEALAAARGGLVGDFAGDRQLAETSVDEMWGDTVNLLARAEGRPDLPMVDGLPAERFREFLDELDELEQLAQEDDDDGADDDDDEGVAHDEGDDGGYGEGYDDDEDDEEVEDWAPEMDDDTLSLFDVDAAAPEGPAQEGPRLSFDAATWVYFIEAEWGDDVDPCLIRFGAGGWQLYFPARGQWFRDDVAEKMAMESGLFVRTTRDKAEEWVDILENPSDDEDTGEPRTVESEIAKCLELGFDEETARHVVRMRWANLPDALLSE